MGTKVQFPIPKLDTYASIFASSSAVQRPLLTFDLSQQGGLPIEGNGGERERERERGEGNYVMVMQCKPLQVDFKKEKETFNK